MKRIDWDLMRPQDIEIRPATIQNGKATLLLFQDSRNTMNALDRNFGEFGWKISYKDVAGQIYGCLSIKDPETGEWISKEDTGEKSNISEDKGLSSDILKRCAVRFGYGRELYSAPRIIVDDDGYNCKGYSVKEISYDGNRNIIHLVINNKFGKEVYRWDEGIKTEPRTNDTSESENMKENRIDQLKSFCHDLKENGEDKNVVLKFYNYYTRPDKDNPDKTIIETRRFFNLESLWNKWKENER